MDKEALYVTVGAMVVSNIATIGTIIFYGIKALWFVSKIDHTVQSNTKDINEAHIKIREVERRLFKEKVHEL